METMRRKEQGFVWKSLEEMTLEEKLGQMFVTGFPEGEMDGSFIRLVKDYKVGNVILFKENLCDRKQIKKLCSDIQNLMVDETGTPAFITIDEEGGIVSRLPDSLGKMPSAMALSAIGSEENLYEAALLSGKQLAQLGINFNLAPVLDINSNPANPVIGIRSYGADAGTVCRYASEAIKGYMDAGILCSGKHFPGHGDTAADSHLSLPFSEKSEDELSELELIPFQRAVDMEIPAITIAHVVYKKLDCVPATMSREIVSGLLREKMGFGGLIISDCMEMNAISSEYGIERGVIEAVAAGIELIFISHKHDKVRSAIEALQREIAEGHISMELIDAAVEKILALKKKYLRLTISEDETLFERCGTFARKVFLEGVHVGKRREDRFVLGESPCFIAPCQTQVSQVSNAVRGLSFAAELQKEFGGHAVEISLRPTKEEIESALCAAREATAVVVGTLNATVYKEQSKLLHLLADMEIPMACVTLRNPFELEGLRAEVFTVPVYEYSARALEAVKEFFVAER